MTRNQQAGSRSGLGAMSRWVQHCMNARMNRKIRGGRGTFMGMEALGFSINMLTLFGMVLAIGIVVDDAIVVIENVERIMASEGLEPRLAADKAIRMERIEPDFVQVGNMTVQIRGRANARSPVIEGPSFLFGDTATGAQDQTVPIKNTFRLLSLKFSTNVVGGNYQLGETVGHIEPADGRITQ